MGNRQKAKQSAVKKLADDVAEFDAATIEYVGHVLIQSIEGSPLLHRGINRDGKAAGYTVDTFSADRTVVGEYSTEAGYFEAPFEKLKNDCKHAKKQAPDCRRLYLFSNQPCRNTDWEKVKNAVKQEVGVDCKFEVYDRDRLAGDIYDQAIVKNSLVEYFSDFLPNLWKIWAENAISHSAPRVPEDFVQDETRKMSVEQLVEQGNVVVLHGLSGTGKSCAAMGYVDDNAEKYRNVIWMPGKELEGATSLSAVDIARLGVGINLASHLSSSPCLLVIDDWKGDVARLLGLLPDKMHKGTKVLITCIGQPTGGLASIELPPLSRKSAERILTIGVENPPSSEYLDTICNRVGFHPLTLAIIRDTVREIAVPWRVIVDDLVNIPKYEGPDHETILQRILLRHGDGVAEELRALKFLGVVAVDSALALSVLGPGGLSKLMRRSLLRKDNRGMCRMHDLVYACLQHYDNGEISRAETEGKIKRFLLESSETGSYHFHRSLQIHSDLIKSWVNAANPIPSEEVYLCQLTERIHKTREFIEAIRTRRIKSYIRCRFACLSVVEAIEQCYWDEPSKEVQATVLEEGIENITDALTDLAKEDLESDLLHHRGKLHFWNNQLQLAIEDFEDVLRRNPKAFQAHLQLAKVKARLDDNGCIRHIEVILDSFARDDESVGITIVLAAFTELAKRPFEMVRKKYLETDVEILSDAIDLAVAEGYSQPYRTLGHIGRYVFYENPERVISMVEHVSFPAPNDAKPSECFSIAEVMKSVGKAFAETPGNEGDDLLWLERAIEYYEKMPTHKEFHLTMMAECLIRLSRHDEALAALERSGSEGASPHWWHRRAQALAGLAQPDLALEAIEMALELNQDLRYASAFLEAKARIEASKGLKSSVETLSDAVAKAGIGKFRDALMLELVELKGRFE